MKLEAIAAFDIRVSFGLDDDALIGCRISTPIGLQAHITLPDGTPGFGVENPLGRGITLTLPPMHPFESRWRQRARDVVTKCISEIDTFPSSSSDTIVEAVQATLANEPLQIEIEVLAVGVAALSARCEYSPSAPPDSRLDAFAIALLYTSLEQSAYFEETSTELLEIIDSCLLSTDLVDTRVSRITRRRDARTLPWTLDPAIRCSELLPCFTLCVVPDGVEEEAIAYQVVDELNAPGSTSTFPIGCAGSIRYGWVAIALIPRSGSEEERPAYELDLVELVRLASLQFEAARAIERLLTERLALAVHADQFRAELNSIDLASVRALASSVADRTSSRCVTVRSDVQAFLNRFAMDANVRDHQVSILQKSQALYEVYRDVLADQAARRAGRLSLLLSFLTILSVISVASDVIGSVNFEYTFFTNPKWRTRTWWLIAPVAVTTLTMLAVLVRSPKYSLRTRRTRTLVDRQVRK